MFYKKAIALLAGMILAVSTNTAVASPVVEGSEVNAVVIRVNEDGEIDSIKTPAGGMLRTQSGQRAPDCIHAESEWGFVQVYNDCPIDFRVKVIFAFGFDSACKLVIAGTRTNISPKNGRIDGIETC